MDTQKPGKESWYFVGCKPKSDATCQCGERAAIIHSLELHATGQPNIPRAEVCLDCAEELVRAADKGLPTWCESTTGRGGLGYQGWTSRWHWEDYNGPWEPVAVGVRRG
jgi:hypothetical protein